MKLYTFVVHYLQMCMKEYGCCPKFKRGDNSTYTFTKRGGMYLVSATPTKLLIGERRGFKRGQPGWKWVTWGRLGWADRRRRGGLGKGATGLGRAGAWQIVDARQSPDWWKGNWSSLYFWKAVTRATTFKESTIFRNKVRPGKIWWEAVLEGWP